MKDKKKKISETEAKDIMRDKSSFLNLSWVGANLYELGDDAGIVEKHFADYDKPSEWYYFGDFCDALDFYGTVKYGQNNCI